MGQLVTTYTVLQALSLEYIVLHDSKLSWLSAGCLLYIYLLTQLWKASVSSDDNKTILIDHWVADLVINGMGINNLYAAPLLIFKMAIYS